jgi:hypothetical protein
MMRGHGEANANDVAFGVIVRESFQPQLIYSQDIEVWRHFPGTYMGVIHSDMELPRVLEIIQKDDPGEYQHWQTSEIEDKRWVTFVKL